jgi:hypothetical protein
MGGAVQTDCAAHLATRTLARTRRTIHFDRILDWRVQHHKLQMVLEDVAAVVDFNDPFHVAADEPDTQAL